MNLQSNDFELFDTPVQFSQDQNVLDARWKVLQREAHPDKFAAHGAAAQRLALQWSVRINEAYQRLKDPLKRASYLCELHGAPIRAEDNTAMPGAFLMLQMAWREALDDAKTSIEIDEIASESALYMQNALLKLEQLIDVDKNLCEAAQQVRCLMFVERFHAEVDARLERLEP